MVKVKVTLSLDDDLWCAFRMDCIQHKTSASQEITEMFRQHFASPEQLHERVRARRAEAARLRQEEADTKKKKAVADCGMLVAGVAILLGAIFLGGCTATPRPPLASPETEAICAPLVPAVASALTSVEHGNTLDAHEAAQMRLWESSCQGSAWHFRLTDQLYGTHPPVMAAPAPDTRTMGQRILDVLVDNHRGGAGPITTCRTTRTGRYGSNAITTCTTF